MRDGVVHVQQVEVVTKHHLVHADGQRQVVGRILEQRIAPHVHFVEEDARQERRQPEGLLIRDEMDLVTTLRERDTEFRGNGSRAAVRGITGDADFHAFTSSHQA